MSTTQDVMSPAVDIFENAEGYLLMADMPGVHAESLAVEVEGNELRVSGANGVTYERRFRLPRGIDRDAAHATLVDGVLTVQISKPEGERPRRIEITRPG
jgi:HSP20 family protein